MLEISPLIAALACELLAALLVAILLLTYGRKREQRRNRAQANDLVERINLTDNVHRENLARALPVTGDLLDGGLRDETIEAVLRKEKELYRQALQAFLTQDAQKLAELDVHVRGLSEPYARLIAELLERAKKPAAGPATVTSDDWAQALESAHVETARARAQLQAAMDALQDMSEEYAKMFGNGHTAAELRESADHVLGSLRQTVERLNGSGHWSANGAVP